MSKNEFGIGSDCCKEDFIDTFAFFAEKLELHPRDIEQSYATLIIALKKIGKNEPFPFIYPLIFLTIIREGRKEFWEHYECLMGRHFDKTVRLDLNNFFEGRLHERDRTIHNIWKEFCFANLDQRSFKSNTMDEILDVGGKALLGYKAELHDKVETLAKRLDNFRNSLPEYDKLDKGNLFKYIDSLLNFSNKFNKGEP